MDLETTIPHTSTLLSLEELLAVLEELEVTNIAGVDGDPLQELPSEQQTLVLNVARRALRARELAEEGAEGDLMLKRELLISVGTCAYADSGVFAFHWRDGNVGPTQFFGHSRASDFVAHTVPAAFLHRFALLASQDQLIQTLLDFCAIGDFVQEEPYQFQLAPQDFSNAREQATESKSKSKSVLLQAGVPDVAADALAESLANTANVSVLQTVKAQGDEPLQSLEFTLIQNSHHLWWVMPTTKVENAPLLVKTVRREDLERDLAAWFGA